MFKHFNWDKITNERISAIFLIICLMIPSVKLFFVWVAVYVSVLWWKNRSWEKTVIYAYWPLSVYYIGQLYVFQVISPNELNHPLYPDGRSLYFRFTPFLVLGMAMLISWIWMGAKYRFRTNWLIVVLLVTVGLMFISNMINSGIMPLWIEIMKMAGNLAVVVWLWWVTNYLLSAERSVRSDFWKYWSGVIKIAILIGSCLVVIQGVKGSPLGLLVEQSSTIPFFGAGSDESGILNRPIGLGDHANGMSFIMMTQLAAWGLIQLRFGDRKGQKQWWLILPVVALLWMQSRSVWLGMGIVSLWCLVFERGKLLAVAGKYWRWWVLLIAAGVLIVTPRLWSSIMDTGKNSGWDTRANLVEVTKMLVVHYPWWGVGDGNFISAAFRNDLTGIFKTFPEPVHNGFWLILAEQGVIGLTVWLVFIGLYLMVWIKKFQNNAKLLWLGLAGLGSQLVVMMFQPFSGVLVASMLVGVIVLSDDE